MVALFSLETSVVGTSVYVLFGSLLLYLCYWYIYGRFQFFKRMGIPGPKPDIFFGNSLQIIRDYPSKLYVFIDDNLKKYNGSFGYYIFGEPTYVTTDPEILKGVLVKQFDCFRDRTNFVDRPYPLNLMIGNAMGEQWKFIRSKLAPAFSSVKLKLMSSLFNDATNTCIGLLQEKINNESIFDISRVYQGFTMEVIISASFGVETKSQTQTNSTIGALAKEFFLGPPKWWSLLRLLPLHKYFLKYVPNKFFDTTRKLWSNAMPVFEERKKNKAVRWDLLQLMVDTQLNKDDAERMTDDEIFASCCIFLAAGYETSSTTLTTLTYELAKHPEYQEKLYEEVCSIWKDISILPDYELVQKMKYMDVLINEALRLYPPGAVIVRACNKDTTIKGVTFYNGTFVVAPIWSLHRDPKFWEKPNEFYPDHFSEEATSKRDETNFMPFGYGPRMCIAVRFAILEMKIVLTRLVKQFKFVKTEETPDNIEIAMGITAVPKGKIPLKVESR